MAASGEGPSDVAASGEAPDAQASEGAASDEAVPGQGAPERADGQKPGAGAGAAATAALVAAVRAVERGERSADSFFNDRARPAARRPRDPQAAHAAQAPHAAQTPYPRQAADAPQAPGGAPAGPAPHTVRPRAEGGAPEQDRPAPPAATGAGAAGATAAYATGPMGQAPAHPDGAGPLAPGIDGVRQVLAAGGAPESLAGKTAEVLGERAAQALREDPWQLLAVPGVRPEQADGFARALLGPACGPADERRAQALVGWLLEQAAVAGHSALEAPALRAALAQRSVPDPDQALQLAIADGAVLVFQDAIETPSGARPAAPEDTDEADEPPVRVLLGLDRFAMAEESVADGLARLLNTFDEADAGAAPATGAKSDDGSDGGGAGDTAADGVDAAPGTASGPARPGAEDWEAAAAAAPSPSAAELIRAAARAGLVTHTGAQAARAEPAALVAAARAMGLRAYGATHSADGRRRLGRLIAEAAGPEGTGHTDTATDTDTDTTTDTDTDADGAAVTLAGLLAGREGPGRDADGALALDLLVVLDAPQLDLETAAALVESLADGTRLVLSGDPGVLWSAGPGKLFADLLAARFCPHVASRTPDFGPIGELVSGVGIGELNQVEAPGKEVVIVPVRDAGEAVHRTVQLVADSVPRAIGVPPEHTRVITVGHGGSAGTRALNAALKERLNPGPGRFGGFDPGDRVAYSPAPGRTVEATVTGADAAGLHLDCGGSALVVPRERVTGGAVRHGWALTAHQAAGMRWPAVVAVLPGDAAKGLTRAWVYTAFSRAERHLSVVQGVDQALARAVAEIPVKDRTTRLRTLLSLHGDQPAGSPMSATG
ncbi:helix-hairpin-helix domain-containing protein [Streptomyces sp. MST-110588]|uniref:helix-hairpin-helix domain-containing protein n=1 Tax=Streptomyces sp. MST-110588 TaxID=2833628 RepID=UPI001F5C9546|nr:helix-hairpin-helix domain-containing protein [Streptomyces sp. MST-110588]